MITEHADPGALVLLANFVSPLAADLAEETTLRRWSEQAPRKLWLMRPDDVLITPVPVSDTFRRYTCLRLGIPEASLTVLTVPDTPHLPMAQAVTAHGLLEPLRTLVRERPEARLLPIALDEAAVRLAADLGIGVAPYEAGGPRPDVVRLVADLNTKTGFRTLAGRLGMRLPEGRECTSADLDRVTAELLTGTKRVVVKPDRSAGGHGMRFVTRGDPRPPLPAGTGERWVVERYVEHTRAVSAQGHAAPGRARVLYDGEMRMSGGSFAGYLCPPCDLPGGARAELADWTLALGRHLAAEGYRGPYSLDAVCAADGTLYALECNVRRTATSTVHALVTRLAGTDRAAPVWAMGTMRAEAAMPFDAAVERLIAAGLDVRPGTDRGVILYVDRPTDDGEWRYVALAPDHGGVDALEIRLAAAFGGHPA
ncbi:hypothetical protein B4N89_42965 [Embleya scabrispora]|uniref:ATP-grasp domain-containing protein n=1 Tax=Embleya scabrispora TaxID=159449 RepID=A0A1T3NKJ2_9ACTN|nr:peptide ligase PGM1-related protein [Embleya scabrispora]OPC77292.1 hypothetical protein B4N89_42965 [Embleya scabrispora]